MQYELFYLVGERQEANLEAIREGVNAMLKLEGATMVEEEITEKRKLAYEIKHQKKGTYITRRFELADVDYWADEKNAEKEFGIKSINNKLNLTNDVLRFMIVKASEMPALGSKDRRKAQELSGAKANPIRNERPARKEVPKKIEKEMPKTQTAPTAEAKAPAEQLEKKIEKEAEAKNIDKQLDELLNI